MNDSDDVVKECEEDKTVDVEMVDEVSIPNSNVHVDRASDNDIVLSDMNGTANDVNQDNVQPNEQLRDDPVNDSEKKMERSKNVPPVEVNGHSKADVAAVRSNEIRDERPMRGSTTNSVVAEKTNTSRNGDTQVNVATKAPQSQRQTSSTSSSSVVVGGGGVVDRNSSIRSNYPMGSSQQYVNKPRDGNVDRNHDAYARSRNDGPRNDAYNSSSSRSYHTMDHGGRLTRGDAIAKDHVSAASGARSRDDMPRGNTIREDHHRPSGGDGSRWDGGEWRSNDHPRGPPGVLDYHHGRGGVSGSSSSGGGGGGSNSNDRSRDSGRGSTNAPGPNNTRSRSGGNTWPRESDGNSRR